MAKSSSGDKKSKKLDTDTPDLSVLDMKELPFQLDGKTYNVEDAPDEAFDTWIRQFVKVGWTLEDRVDAINTALKSGTLKMIQSLPSEDLAS